MSDIPHGSVRLYHPSGLPVTLPVPVDPKTKYDFRAALEAVTAALSAGWLAAPPGVAEGEERELVGSVVRSAHEGRGGLMVPVVDLYGTAGHHIHPFMRVYLDTKDDVADFEYASKLKLTNLLEHDKGRLERGKAASAKYFAVPPRPFGVVFKLNPAFDPDETDVAKKKPKRLFERWVDERPAVQPATTAPPAKSSDDEVDAQREIEVQRNILSTRVLAAKTDAELVELWKDTPDVIRNPIQHVFVARRQAIAKGT